MSILWNSHLVLLLSLISAINAIEFVHIRSGPFGQLITSNTLRWMKESHSKDPVTVPNDGRNRLCHLATGPRSIGLVDENGQCKVLGQDGREEISSSFQTLSGHAARVIWSEWRVPYPPPTGAVALSQNPTRFVAYSRKSDEVGYVDTKLNLGSCIFASGVQSSCDLLTEIEPVRYQLSDVELKKSKGFVEEPVILATTTLIHLPSDEENNGESHGVKSRTEQVLSYQLNQFEYWGQGLLMAKGLHTSIKLSPKRSKVNNDKTIIVEWGLPSASSGKVETVPVWEDLEPGTGINITIRGVHRKGDMTYWATLKTFFKDDGPYATRHVEGQRKVDQIEDIQIEKSKMFYLADGRIVVTEETTLPTSTRLSTQMSGVLDPTSREEEEQQQDMTSSHLPPHNDLKIHQTSNLMLNSKAKTWSSDNGLIYSIVIIFLTLTLQRIL